MAAGISDFLIEIERLLVVLPGLIQLPFCFKHRTEIAQITRQ